MLESVGFSTVESRLYATLVDNPRSSTAELSELCGLPARTVSRAMAQLVRRGAASRLPGRHARYMAAAPDVVVQPLVNRREDELHQMRAAIRDLTAAYLRAERHTHPAELIEVVTGARNIVNRAFTLQDSAHKLIRGIDKPPYVMHDANNDRELVRLREGVEFRGLYDRESVALPGKLEYIRLASEHGEKVRVLAHLPLKMWVIDDSAALIPILNTRYKLDAAFVVHPSSLLDALIALFDREWERAIPLRTFTGQPDLCVEDRGGEQRTLLALLASGQTDEGIARSQGLSLRTVQRRIQHLLRQLNVTTRFQAGMAARDRGWI